jgi:hypothetical protein
LDLLGNKEGESREEGMSNELYTKADLDEFRELVELGESKLQLDRITSRLEMPRFIKKHGEQKCNAMFEVLKKGLE